MLNFFSFWVYKVFGDVVAFLNLNVIVVPIHIRDVSVVVVQTSWSRLVNIMNSS